MPSAGGVRSEHFVVALIAAAAYLSGLYGDWLDDDPVAITENIDVQCPSGLSGLFDNAQQLFSRDFWGTPLDSEDSHLSYRPLTILSFRLQHCLVGFHSLSFHMLNAILHSLVCVLLMFACAEPVLPSRSQRTLAGMLFALHAVHVEAVTNTVGRAELLSACFFFAALIVYRRAFEPRGSCRRINSDEVPSLRRLLIGFVLSIAAIAMTLAIATAAMLCKEAGITALLCCGALDCCLVLYHHGSTTDDHETEGRRRWRVGLLAALVGRSVLLAIGAAAILHLRLSMQSYRSPSFTSHDNSAAFCPTYTCRALTYSYLWWLNLKLLMLPMDLSHDWSMTTVPNLTSPSDPRVTLAVVPYLVVAMLLALAASAWHQGSSSSGVSGERSSGSSGRSSSRRSSRSRAVGLVCGLSLLLLPFLPACHALLTVGFTIAERVLYLPSGGYSLLVATLLGSPRQGESTRRLLRRIWPLALLTMHAILTLRRNVDWRTNEALLLSGASNQPRNAKLRYNLGVVLHSTTAAPAAAAVGKDSAGGGDGHASSTVALAREQSHDVARRSHEALHHLRAARALQPLLFEASCVEAHVLRGLGRPAEAEAVLRSTLTHAAAEAATGDSTGDGRSGDGRSNSGGGLLGWISARDASIRQQLRKERAAASQHGVFYASRGLGDLLASQQRHTESLLAYKPALEGAGRADVNLARDAARVASLAQQSSVAAALWRHARRLQPAHSGVPPVGSASETARHLYEHAREPAHPSRASTTGQDAGASPALRAASTVARDRPKAKRWAQRLEERRSNLY